MLAKKRVSATWIHVQFDGSYFYACYNWKGNVIVIICKFSPERNFFNFLLQNVQCVTSCIDDIGHLSK